MLSPLLQESSAPSFHPVSRSLSMPWLFLRFRIGGLLAGGMIPGIMLGVALMITSYIISVRRKYPKRIEKMTGKEIIRYLPRFDFGDTYADYYSWWILSGIFTATEAAAVGVMYSFVISFFIFRELPLAELPGMFLRTGIITAVVMIIIGTSNIFGMVMAFEQFAIKLEHFVKPLGYFWFIFSVNILLLIVGTFMDQNPAILILGPVLAPIAHHLGIHPIQFGWIFILNIVLGMLTPPLGAVLFVVSPIAKVPVMPLVKELLPFLLVEIGVLGIVSYVPAVSLWLPGLLGYIK